MTITDRDSSVLLCEEIIANARRESDDILNQARKDADFLRCRAGEEAEEARLKRLEEARLEGERRKEITRASTFVECRRLRLSRIEAVLDSIRSEIREKIARPPDKKEYSESVVGLAIDAIKHMKGNDFHIRLREEDRLLLDGDIAGLIAAHVGNPDMHITLSFEPIATGGGPIVEDASGHQVWDNSYLARIDRLWPDLRRIITEKVFGGGHGEDDVEGGKR